MDRLPETRALLPKSRFLDNVSSEEDDWSDSYSSSYSDSSSSIAEWEHLVDSFGELLYIDCHPQVPVKEEVKDEPLARTVTRRSTRGKLSRLIKRREQKRCSTRSFTSYTDAYAPTEIPKVTFQDFQEGEMKEISLHVDPQNRAKFGRRMTIVEALLGINIAPFSDGTRVMVAGFVPDRDAAKNSQIKIGDCVKSINATEVTHQTINAFLERITEPQNVTVQLQRIAGVDVTRNSDFVRQLTAPNANEDEILSEILCNYPVGVLYLKTEGLTETGPEYDGVLYCYPKPMNRNVLCSSRGTFLTLHHLLPEAIKTKPHISTILMNHLLTHVAYHSSGDKLLIMAFPDMRCSSFEALRITNEVVKCLEFCYGSLDEGFERFRTQADGFFSRFFARLITSGTWYDAVQKIDLNELKDLKQAPVQFENLLPAATYVALPREAQMQLDDALNELESGDYRDWNEDPLNCQRMFTIVGSAFYHSGYLLASHLNRSDLVDVHLFCRQQGMLHLSCTEPIRSLVLWRRVYPASLRRDSDEPTAYKTPDGRWYLLIVGNAKDLLMVLMEAGGCTSPPEENQSPDVFYVEEAQETLHHIQNMGISALADKWLSLNSRPQIAVVDTTANKPNKKNDFFTFAKSTSPTPAPSKKTEITSILKHRSPKSATGSVFSGEDVSEDSASQEARSEISDEPVIGRRAAREKDSDSDSDWDNYRPNSEISGSFDISDLKQLSDLIPLKITAGNENVLYNYVSFDATEGVLMCPPVMESTPAIMEQIYSNFRKSSQSIHALFQNTIRFKTLLAQDMVKLVVNKSLIAIKEHGMLFECHEMENGKRATSVLYWVVGRLFYNPHPRELYVCYQDSAPQNLIELAFRLGMNAAG